MAPAWLGTSRNATQHNATQKNAPIRRSAFSRKLHLTSRNNKLDCIPNTHVRTVVGRNAKIPAISGGQYKTVQEKKGKKKTPHPRGDEFNPSYSAELRAAVIISYHHNAVVIYYTQKGRECGRSKSTMLHYLHAKQKKLLTNSNKTAIS